MFVSPPPASTTGRGLSKRQGGTNHHRNKVNQGFLQSIPEGSSAVSYAPSMGSSQSLEGSLYQTDSQSQISVKKDTANFVNAPPEYADRARDEIRKRLLPVGSRTHRYNRADSEVSSRRSSDNRSVFSNNTSSDQSSIFSQPSTVFTHSTVDSSAFLPPPKIVTHVSLQDALPKSFYDMYAPEILMSDPSNILCNGRPKFTERALLDWELNDIRSLLIVEKCRPEWGNQLPEIVTDAPNLPHFRFQLLPLNSSDAFIIETLVTSDLYMEANLDDQFKLTSARYTVAAARKRHEQMTGRIEPIMELSKPEWRNIVENYLLNIAVEAQCRFDFKHRCSEYKKFKFQQSNLKRPHMPPPKLIPNNDRGNLMENKDRSSNGSSLLKKALLKNLQLKSFNKNNTGDNNTTNDNNKISTGSIHQNEGKISLTEEEKAMIWSQCQAQVYQRLGLDWQPDKVS
ncbi:hypothetical protein HG537_0G02790 [Torulaspora globosa]|uniref:Uncharacterized protein n=1 Tax=Torulaspora globosa TaxID=48254 RepID=A0A7H9HZK7_9SACH|nr:hypothetical protein HG537_0G02790 [Torulaspora sp. CBS 2947]